MRNKLAMAIVAALVSGAAIMPAPALAQRSGYHRQGRTYHGHGYNRHNRRRCGGGNGAVGTIAGGAGGALIGNTLGGGTLGTVAGGVGGALLGRHLDKQNSKNRNHC